MVLTVLIEEFGAKLEAATIWSESCSALRTKGTPISDLDSAPLAICKFSPHYPDKIVIHCIRHWHKLGESRDYLRSADCYALARQDSLNHHHHPLSTSHLSPAHPGHRSRRRPATHNNHPQRDRRGRVASRNATRQKGTPGMIHILWMRMLWTSSQPNCPTLCRRCF